MRLAGWLSPAQLFGYVGFVLGVGRFLQTDDRRFKGFLTGECVAYVVHFLLSGNATAVVSSALSMLRSVLTLTAACLGALPSSHSRACPCGC